MNVQIYAYLKNYVIKYIAIIGLYINIRKKQKSVTKKSQSIRGCPKNTES